MCKLNLKYLQKLAKIFGIISQPVVGEPRQPVSPTKNLKIVEPEPRARAENFQRLSLGAREILSNFGLQSAISTGRGCGGLASISLCNRSRRTCV